VGRQRQAATVETMFETNTAMPRRGNPFGAAVTLRPDGTIGGSLRLLPGWRRMRNLAVVHFSVAFSGGAGDVLYESSKPIVDHIIRDLRRNGVRAIVDHQGVEVLANDLRINHSVTFPAGSRLRRKLAKELNDWGVGYDWGVGWSLSFAKLHDHRAHTQLIEAATADQPNPIRVHRLAHRLLGPGCLTAHCLWATVDEAQAAIEAERRRRGDDRTQLERRLWAEAFERASGLGDEEWERSRTLAARLFGSSVPLRELNEVHADLMGKPKPH